LANFIAGRKHELEFVVPLVKIDRNDSIDVREMILNMTPSQRKMLGINKSTLWYQKRNLREGKCIKLYNKSKTGVLQDKPTVAKMQWLQRGHGDIHSS
jgi:CRISP-associated protein Cas1